jgi:hypothetical protein
LKSLFERLSATGKPDEKTITETNGVRRTEITIEREWITEIWRVAAGGVIEKVHEAQPIPETRSLPLPTAEPAALPAPQPTNRS